MKECKCVKKSFLPQMADFSWGVRKMKSNLSSNPRRKNFQSNEKSPIPDKFQRLLYQFSLIWWMQAAKKINGWIYLIFIIYSLLRVNIVIHIYRIGKMTSWTILLWDAIWREWHAGLHNLRSFLAANLNQNYFLIACVKIFVTFGTKVPYLTFCNKMWRILM